VSAPVLTFLGATGTVTGSRFLVDTPGARILVDCGMFQGPKPLRLRNWAEFPVDPASIDAVVITHAHLDHTGLLPLLARRGFAGPVFATHNTIALSGIVLPDSGHLQEEDAAYANRKGFSKHHPALPLYTEADAYRMLTQFDAVPFGTETEVGPGVHASFAQAGHILGSATVTLRLGSGGGRRVVFSGDLGRPTHPLLRPPEPISAADSVVIESTYGDRTHEDEDACVDRFARAIRHTAEHGGTVLIPAFAVDRTEVVLLHLQRLVRAGAVPNLPVYVDSPMALAALAVYRRAIAAGDPEVRGEVAADPDPFDPGRLIEVHDVEQSKSLDAGTFPSIIVSASGMATGGRVLHHLARFLPHHRNTVVLAGFQAEATRGRLLQQGARVVKLLGHYVPVRARIVDISGLSVHADRGELLGWLRTAPEPPDTTFVVHGEPDASSSLREAIERDLGWTGVVPRFAERVLLD
jgi:metallo-beta-lactamase family protein